MATCTTSEFLSIRDPEDCADYAAKCHTPVALRMRITSTQTAEVPHGHMGYSSAGTLSRCGSPWLSSCLSLTIRYIFMNMFTGVVVESFAYVYQRPGGVSVNREELSTSAFKDGDTNRTDE